MLAGVVAISFGLDTGVLASVSTVNTGVIEQKLINRLSPQATALGVPPSGRAAGDATDNA
jgi:hypothetical protein